MSSGSPTECPNEGAVSVQIAQLIVQHRIFFGELRPLLPGAPAALPGDPVAALEALRRLCPALRLRLLPYRTVARRGLLLAVRCDSIRLNGHAAPSPLAAISCTPVSDGGAYHALTGGIS